MLRRLFISLLILSALTSDGIVNLPANIYNLYIYSGGQLGLSEVKAVPSAERQPQQQEKGSLVGLVPGRMFVLSAASMEKIKSGTAIQEISLNYGAYPPCVSINPFSVSFFRNTKDFILEKSDTSPPILVLPV